jgi:hypothetical protein
MNVKGMYTELITTSLLLNIFDAFLTFGAIFSIGFFIVYFYRLHYLFALVPAIVFFLRSLYIKIKQNKILLLESKYPDLKERLRTSYDHQEQSNTVVNELHSDIMDVIKDIDVNTFLTNRKLMLKVGVILAMLVSTLYFSSIGFDMLDIKNAIIKSPIYRGASNFVLGAFDKTRDEVKNRDKLDKAKMIKPGDKEFNVSIQAYNTELDTSQINNPEKNDYGGNYPSEVTGAAQEVYEEKIPEEYKDAVKEYFKKINS